MQDKYTRIDLYNSNYGGRAYEKMIDECFPNLVKTYYVFKTKSKFKIIFSFLYSLIKFNFFSKKNHLLTLQTIPFINLLKKNVLIIHHIDIKYSSLIMRLYYNYCLLFIFIFRSRIKKIVVVSKYWKEYLEKKGFNNVEVIYNSIEIKNFDFSDNEINSFKVKYKIDLKKPIIYIGNLKLLKGFDKVYDLLKNEPYVLVGSGNDSCNLQGVICLNLPYKEYLLLLKSSDVVILMSEFLEGWNRTAHEAILLGKKVIGSGSGGMKELLEKENRLICKDYNNLISLVKKEIEDNDKNLTSKLIHQYDKIYFKHNWFKVLNECA